MNSGNVHIKIFAVILAFLFLAVGTVFGNPGRICQNVAEPCCSKGRAHNVECTLTHGTSREASRPTEGSCCATITSAPQGIPVAVFQQDNDRVGWVAFDAVPSVVLDLQLPRFRSPFRGRPDLYDSHLRTSAVKYVLTSVFLI